MTSYDLTQPIESGMPVYPDDPAVELRSQASHRSEGYRVMSVSMGTHTGTHVDAPSHTERAGRELDSFPVDRFQFRALRVDCRRRGPDDPISTGDLPEEAGAADMLVLWTRWDDHWGTDRYWEGPYLTPGAAQFCAERDLAVGVDAPSVDPPESLKAHHELLGEECLIVENLTNLGAPPDHFDLRAYPIAVGEDGAPVRAVAVA